MWIILSILGAFSQALSAAIKKKMLQTEGINNFIGFVSFSVAGLLFALIYFMKTGNFWHENLSLRFWESMGFYAGLNIVAVWFMYKAIDSAEFSYLMPFMTITSLSMIVPPIFILKEIPTLFSLFGIVLIVWGVIYMNYRPKDKNANRENKKKNRSGAIYFVVTAICFTFTPTAAKIAIQESSVLFASYVVHFLIGLGFLVILVIAGESKKMLRFVREPGFVKYFLAIAIAGIIIVLENGSINMALSVAPVAYVMALKRLMPFFAFLIGYFYFKEKTDFKIKVIGTALLILGAILITFSS